MPLEYAVSVELRRELTGNLRRATRGFVSLHKGVFE
jgi:hypothetical protein